MIGLRKQQRKEKPKKSKYFKNTRELPCHIYNEIVLTGNLNLLIIKGLVSEDVLNDTWSKIKVEIIEITNNTQVKTDIDLVSRFMELSTELRILEIIQSTDSKKNNENVLKELKLTSDKIKKRINYLNLKVPQIKSKLPKQEEKETDKNEFEKILATLNKLGYNIDRYKTSTSQYFTSYMLALKELESKNNNNK